MTSKQTHTAIHRRDITHTSRLSWRRFMAVLAAVALLGSTAVAVARSVIAQEPPEEGGFTLTILHNNDGESQLLPNEDNGFPGVARFVAAIKELQAASTSDGVITLTAGDNFLASKELNVSLERGTPYYDSIALSGIYDAMTLGNHDFDLGPDVTAAFISGFDPAVPFVSANIDFSAEPVLVAVAEEGRLAKSTVVEYGDVSVGVIGAITPQLPNISSPRGVVVGNVAEAVNAEARRLTSEGVNIIILISHLQSVTEELELVPQLSGVDVVIAGGGDELLSNDDSTCLPQEEPAGIYPLADINADGNSTPVITAPGGYRCIGELNITFDTDGNVFSHRGRTVGVALDGTPDPAVQTAVVEPLSEALASLQTDVIGTSEVGLDGRRSMVRTTETNLGNLMAESMLEHARSLADAFGAPTAQVGLQNGGGIRNDSVIPAGEITTADTFDIAPFSNFVVVLELPRDTFKIMLEQAIDCVPGTCGQFAQLAGMTLTYDPSAPAREINRDGDCELTGNEGSRVRQVVLDDGTVIVQDGQVVDGPPVVLATIDFLANGGDCYPIDDFRFTRLGVSYQASLARYISDNLGGQITAADFPEGGEGRIVALESAETPASVPEEDATAG